MELKLSGDIPAWLKPAYAVDGLDWLVEMGNDFKKRRIQRELQPLAEDLLRIHKIPIPQGWDVQVPPDSSEGQQGPVAEVNIVPKGESNFYTGQGTVVHFVLKKNEVKVTDFDRGGEIVKKETQILKSGE
ncbi:hypothetical protein HYV84_03910 [Candidatus Woesearchaeota archaeon]|nr:hypothetical protein [Candidatus Woesearchaeota archaeon]